MRGHRCGLVLVLVTWVVVILGLVTTTFLRESMVEVRISEYRRRRLVLRSAAESAVERVVAQLSVGMEAGEDGRPLWMNDPDTFQNQEIGEAEVSIYYFDLDEKTIRYGIVDESSRLNLMTTNESIMGKLPLSALTEDPESVVAAVLDWIDEDSQPRSGGAEREEYSQLDPPQEPRNGLVETMGELLFVQGVSPLLLYGEDVNRNGRLDSNESDGEDRWPPDNGDSELDPGLVDFLTVYSYDKNVDNEGTKRVDLNKSSDQELTNRLRPRIGTQKTNMIVAARALASTQTPFPTIGLLLEVPGITKNDFKKIVDLVSVTSEDLLPGLVNVVTAPRAVLLCLPGMTEELADRLIEARVSGAEGLDLTTLGWVLDVVGENRFQQMCSSITCRSWQFLLQVVARFPEPEGGGERRAGVYRLRVVLDLAGKSPRFLQYQDWTHRGPVFPNEE